MYFKKQCGHEIHQFWYEIYERIAPKSSYFAHITLKLCPTCHPKIWNSQTWKDDAELILQNYYYYAKKPLRTTN